MKFDLGYINRIVVVSAYVSDSGTIFDYVVLRNKKSGISFEKRGKGFLEISALVKDASSKFPILLHVEGKGIISRMAPVGENYRQNILMNNSGEQDFYFTEFRDKQSIWYSFARRDLIEPIIAQFNDNGAKVIQVSTGPFAVGVLVPYLIRKDILVHGFAIALADKSFVSFEKSSETKSDTVSLGVDTVESFLLPSVAVGTHIFRPSPDLSLPQNETALALNLAEAKQKNIFRRFSAAMISFFAILLCGNYLYLNNLNSKIEENYAELSLHEGQLAQIAQLKDEQQRKESLLKTSGLLNRNFLSYYLMELGNTVPRDITFDEIQVRPLLDEIKDKHKIEFMERLIVLSGRSKTSHILQKWIETLEAKEWVASVEIMNYTYTKNRGNFELQILLN